jgi:hypothetical protein
MKPLRETCRKKVDVTADNSERKPHTRSFESAVWSRQATGLLDKPTRSRQAIEMCDKPTRSFIHLRYVEQASYMTLGYAYQELISDL